MPRDSRSRSVRRPRSYNRRRSGRETSRPRRSPRDRSTAGHSPRFEAPSGWNETSTHWDTRTEYGLNFPKRVESTQFSRKQGLAGQDITEVKVIDLIQSGLSNWGLRLVAKWSFCVMRILSKPHRSHLCYQSVSRIVQEQGLGGFQQIDHFVHSTGAGSQ